MPDQTHQLDPPNPGTLQEDLRCVECGYNLRGLGVQSRCPECGKRVEETLLFPYLASSEPHWRTALSDGLVLLLAAGAASLLAGPLVLRTVSVSVQMQIAICLIPWVLSTWGTWRFTTRERGAFDSLAPLRWLVRACAVIPVAVLLLFFWPDYRLSIIALYVAPWLALMTVPATLTLYRYVRAVSLRIPDRALALQATIVGWGLPISQVLILWFFDLLPNLMRDASEYLLFTPLAGWGYPTVIVPIFRRLFEWELTGYFIAMLTVSLPTIVFVPWAAIVLGRVLRALRGRTEDVGENSSSSSLP